MLEVVDNDKSQDVEDISQNLQKARANISRVIFGQDKVVDLCLSAILSEGHFLLVGLPGLGKTKLVETLGTVLGLDNNRVQYTPDLMPSDIIGSEVLIGDTNNREFKFVKGPIVCQLLMADEINRASPRTQSALLQSMQEKEVSISGKKYQLPTPFHVMATQNPIEQEGTYPLPEAQLDRFIMQIDMDYPSIEEEKKMIKATTCGNEHVAEQAISADELLLAQQLVRELPIGEKVVDAILKLVQLTRPEYSDVMEVKKYMNWGAGPRASQALMLTARAFALIEGRLSPSVDDVLYLAPSILKHRMEVNFAARADGISVEDIIKKASSYI